MSSMRRMSFRDDFHGASFDSLKDQRKRRAEERERKHKEKIEKTLLEAAERRKKEKEEINYNHEIALILQENQKNLEK